MPLGDPWPEIMQNIVGRDARVTFPISRLTHKGGTLALRKWAEVLRALANELDALSVNPAIKEQSALFYAAQAIRDAGRKINRRGRERDMV